jgi:AraC-like DNA-binding protein
VSAFLTACFPTEPLSGFDHFVHRDLDAVEDHLNNVIIPHRLTSAATTPLGSFRHGGVDFGSFNLSSVRYDFDGGELSVACPVMDDDYRIQVTVAGAGRVEGHGSGASFGPAGFVIIHPNRAFRETFDGRCHHLLLTVKREALEQAYAEWVGHPAQERLCIQSSVVDVAGEGRSLVRYLGMLCRVLEREASIAKAPEVPHAVVDSLPQLLLHTLPHNHSKEFHRTPEPLDPAYLRRVEDYLLGKASEEVCMADLVRISGCSARSIHYSFRKLRGVTPMEYLRDYRLAMSRQTLLQPSNAGRSITEIALSCGFNHMSKFTAHYKARFGETPSQTRRRQTIN